ncbi:hypothetical protein SAMN05421858_5046 [Haladaptatus litoreus]|uniref:Uncharacterized protein n=1 Tax=Haladaptatus litoreus TaxID=553468 RepID=A0A1N7FH28_9EURY|nr:phage tail tube protein [Haladaptatus litoreus]SIR99621.1 hypothetical protein SAMN05421858_5046 [Haladaptatus litoreus]
MTGGGAGHFLHTPEPAGDYMGDPGTPTYHRFGKNPSVDDISIQNALIDMRVADDPEMVDTVAGNFEGAFSASWTATNHEYLQYIFNGGGSGSYNFTKGRMNSGRVYAGVDYLDGTAERELKGVVFGELSVTCNQGEAVEISATGFYGDEQKNTSLTGSPAADQEPLIFHSGNFSVGGTNQMKMQSGTLSISSGARLQRGWDRHGQDAVVGGVESTLEVEKIITDTSLLEAAYGGSSAPQQDIGGQAATLDFQSPGGNTLTFNCSDVTPEEYSWGALADPETDVTDSVTFRVPSVTASASDAA